ncbi:hypothetical protein C8J56DRAFT_1049088 [Mycena floridula]|nr:hypothetical protein C8J56DRAFT_1049088 [Mycena floridula]
MVKHSDGNVEYRSMNIVELQKGDAIEAKFCFVAYPTFKTNVSKVLPVLRGITLLEEGLGKMVEPAAPVAKLVRKRQRASDDMGE